MFEQTFPHEMLQKKKVVIKRSSVPTVKTQLYSTAFSLTNEDNQSIP